MSKPIKVVSENIEWLEEEWNKAWDEKESGELKTVPEWWFDDATAIGRCARQGSEADEQ